MGSAAPAWNHRGVAGRKPGRRLVPLPLPSAISNYYIAEARARSLLTNSGARGAFLLVKMERALTNGRSNEGLAILRMRRALAVALESRKLESRRLEQRGKNRT